MTDRFAGFFVTLERDVRSDDAEATLAAIRQVKGVLSVEPLVSTPELHVAHGRARYAIMERLSTILREYREDNR